MQPRSREMQAMNSLLNQSQISLQDLENGQHHQIPNPQIPSFESPATHDDFLEQMLSSLPSCSWPDLAGANKFHWDISSSGFPSSMKSQDMDDRGLSNLSLEHDQSVMLASKLQQHQISGGTANSTAAKSLLLQQQLLMQARGGGLRLPAVGGSGAGETGLLPLPLRPAGGDDVIEASLFKSPNLGADASVHALYNGLAASLQGNGQNNNQAQHFQHPQAQNFGAPAPAPAMNQAPAASGSAGGGAPPGQPRQRVRARRGQATDPHSIAERLRRERIAERMKALQELVPNANKTDKASMLDEIIDYVKFLQLQVKVLSMSRLGGAAAVAPLVADMSSEGGGDCIQANGGTQTAVSTSSNGNANGNGSNDSLTVTEHQVAKLMEEDMGAAMQYLQGKGLCLMPISLATAISTATCHSRNPLSSSAANHPLLATNGGGGADVGGPTSPSMSVLTVQSAAMGNGAGDASFKDSASVSKP
ncbi:hypothetical protein NMG60_11013107 [Bertholletia excelsa]